MHIYVNVIMICGKEEFEREQEDLYGNVWKKTGKGETYDNLRNNSLKGKIL